MAFLKKSLFLILFLGLVPLSFCENDKREGENEEEQDDDQSEEKRALGTLLKGVGSAVATVGKMVADQFGKLLQAGQG
uniref:Dermatoxin-S1 n=1 Tax=Phyllomedusa sauvagei TaxID=8395 RepID=DRT1_PHYSA|nr:RecName: Full=Dermatoxin-S1; Short=DRT-S1; AltName: Full=Dermatoxin; Flags: Precursor [Phyllomedusa sauvagii]CAI26288.1 dermatoxin precursor [Phyllomedusa sauvagii]